MRKIILSFLILIAFSLMNSAFAGSVHLDRGETASITSFQDARWPQRFAVERRVQNGPWSRIGMYGPGAEVAINALSEVSEVRIVAEYRNGGGGRWYPSIACGPRFESNITIFAFDDGHKHRDCYDLIVTVKRNRDGY